MDKENYILLDVKKYLDRGIMYMSFRPMEVQRVRFDDYFSDMQMERRIFVKIVDNISFFDDEGNRHFAAAFDYLDITDLERISCVSRSDFEENYKVVDTSEEIERKVFVKLYKNS